MAARGLSEEGNMVQNTLGSVVSHTPAFLADMAGLQHLFQVKHFLTLKIFSSFYQLINFRLPRQGIVRSSNVQVTRVRFPTSRSIYISIRGNLQYNNYHSIYLERVLV